MKARSALITVALIFLLPLWAAYWLHKSGGHFDTSNRGHLLNPTLIWGQLFEKPPVLPHGWTWLLVAPQGCDESCQQRLSRLKWARALLGKYQSRVHIRLWGESGVPLPSLGLSLKAGEVFLVDDSRWLLMEYGQKQSTRDMLRDMKRLMRVKYG